MRKKGKQSISAGDDSINVLAGRDVNFFIEGNIPTELVDRKIEEEVEKLRKSRFFFEFDRTRSSLTLGGRLVQGELSGGSAEIRSRGLALCARLLSRSDELEQAETYLEFAKTLEDSQEIKIVEAFILSLKGGKAAALQALACIDSDASISAGLIIVAHHDGAEGALQWMSDAGYTVENIDSDGKSFLLNYQFELGLWGDAAQTAGSFSESDFEETPILHHLVALAKLIVTVPADFRAVVFRQIPLEVADFPFAAGAVSMSARRAAHKHFLDAVEAAKQFTCPHAARTADEYALWLELSDPTQAAHGKSRLEEKLRESESALAFVRYAIQFGIKLDLDIVEQDIQRSVAVNGGMTMDAAIAHFALALTKPTAEQAANYIALHQNELAAHIDPKLVQFRQIELFSRAGLIEKANEVLGQLIGKGIPKEEESNLRRLIAKAEGNDPVEGGKAQYRSTGALHDLINLVAELEEHQHWDDLCEFGRLLFKATHSLGDAERLVKAFSNTHRSEALVEFLDANSDFKSQSSQLRMFYAWGLYNEGALVESRAALAELSEDAENPNYRALQVNLGIAMGDWTSLSAYVANEYQRRDERSAHDLMGAANLAFQVGSPHAKDLVFEAAAKAEEDAAILVAAYSVATSAGWENDPQVFQWLESAAELSGDDGPLQRMSLKEILDRKPEWDHQESETWRLLARGQIPIFLAAQSLNRNLIELTTFPALANIAVADPRRRSAISAYSGQRVPIEFNVKGKVVAMEATALLTLSFLKILDVALDSFETIYIPHSTLGWLFEERQKAAFHQPSRITNAHKVRDLVATDVLGKFSPTTVASSDLSAQVGGELAALIAEAQKVREIDDTQHIVVRSAPVHRLSSLMEEEADLSAYAAVLSSCLPVVEKLRKKGQITSKEEKLACVYLQLHERPWPNQPEIVDGATLYLDDLAISYLQHLGLLGKLKAAGLRAVVSPREVSETDALISYEEISDKVKDVIEGIRASLSARIESGQVRVGPTHNSEEAETKAFPEHPSVGIIALASQCDIAIIDDRFLNQHANIDSGGTQTPVLSSLDLTEALVAEGVISNDDLLEHRTRLRRAGYFFVPVCETELERFLMASEVVDGHVAETAELKAIRESVLRVRMTDWLQLPNEALWLDVTLKVFIRVLKSLWKDSADIDEVTVRSSWLYEQVDIRGWAHRLDPENADNIVRIGRGAHILMLLMPPIDTQRETVDLYWNWVEERILRPIEEQFPDLFDWIAEWHRKQVGEMAETELSERSGPWTNRSFSKSEMAQAALRLVPPLIRENLLNQRKFGDGYGFNTDALISFGHSSVSIQRSELFDACRAVLSGADDAEVSDTVGGSWHLENEANGGEIPLFVLSSAEQRLRLPDFAVFSEDVALRIRLLEESAFEVNLPIDAQDRWREILTVRALEDDEVEPFCCDISDTPIHVERSIRSEITIGQSSVSSLVPNSQRYYERLVGTYDGSASIANYAAGAGRKFIDQLSKWRPYDGFLFSLLLSSHSTLTAEIYVDHLDREKLIQAYEFVEKNGDALSRLGAVEVGLRVLEERPEVEPFLLGLIHSIRDDDVEGKASEFMLFSALFVLVDGELSRTRLMPEVPPFYRRLCSLAQASLICRQFIQQRVDCGPLFEWAVSNRGEYYYMQSLTDMRIEPRWNPDLGAAEQIKADFFGRIMIAGKRFEDNIGAGELHNSIFGSEPQSLSTLCEFPRPYLPGPLEGVEDSPNPLPESLSSSIEQQLDSEEVEASSFFTLVNSSLIFKIASGHAELAAKALRLANYRLANLEDNAQLVRILNGLATVAAISRNLLLADELRILVRHYLRDPQFGFSVEEAMRVCLVASAARKELTEWREFAGEWLTELAFSEMDRNEAEVLYFHLTALLHSVPELWVSCARADAALKALCSY